MSMVSQFPSILPGLMITPLLSFVNWSIRSQLHEKLILNVIVISASVVNTLGLIAYICPHRTA
jgi:hypothetical protein